MSKYALTKLVHDELIAAQDTQLARTLCANCAWAHEGTATAGHEAFHQHRLTAHPEIVPPKRKRKGYSISVAARRQAAERQKAA